MLGVVVPLRIQNAADFAHALVLADAGKALVAKTDLSGFELASLDGRNAATLEGHAAAYFLPAADFNPAAFDAAGAAAAVAANLTSHVNLTTGAHGMTAFGAGFVAAADAAAGRTALALGTMATQATGSFLAATGATTGATSQAQTFTNSLIATAGMRPAADTTAYKFVTKADGTTSVITVNTTDKLVAFGHAQAPAAYLDLATGIDFAGFDQNPGLRFRQYNVPTFRWWDFIVALNSGVTALQMKANNGGVVTYPFWVTQDGKFGTGQWSTVGSSFLSGLDRFSIFAPTLTAGAYTGISIIDAITERMYFQATAAASPRTNTNAVQIMYTVPSAGISDLALCAGGLALSTVRIYASNGTSLAQVAGFNNTGLDVVGLLRGDSFRLDATPTAETPSMTHTITISLNGTNYKVPCVAA